MRLAVGCGNLQPTVSLVQIRTGGVHRPPPLQVSQQPLVDPQARTIRYLRVSLTDRCNYRCTYCMPEDGIDHGARNQVLSLEEVARLVRAFCAWGVTRVRLTGGEPTVRKGLLDLIRELSAIELPTGKHLEVVMTTNGERLEAMASELVAAGLSALTVSIDSLRPDRFRQITRRGNLQNVIAGIERARTLGIPLKLNTVAIRGFNDDEVAELCAFAWERGITPRFIELMPMAGGSLFVPGELMPAQAIRDAVSQGFSASVLADLGNGIKGLGPATYWRLSGGLRAGQRFGIIAAMTENFCNTCNRLRVSATGQLHACLARDETGDLRSALRSSTPGALEQRVRKVVGAKRDRHDFRTDGGGGPQKAMISIGG